MTSKITNFFKVKPKSSKIGEDESIPPKIRECQVILKDIKHQLGNNQLKLFEDISLNERNSCKIEKSICKFCGKLSSSKENLLRHMRTLHPTEFDLFTCEICNQSLHEKTHNKQFKCEICNKMFSFNSHLDDHKKTVHENPGSFECEICGKKFNEKSTLKTHQKTHNKNRPKSFQCQRCNYATDNKNRFKVHQKSHERQDKKFAAMKNPLKCKKCPKFYKNNLTLSKHMWSVHQKELFQCDLCAKFIKIKANLINHIDNHIRRINNISKVNKFKPKSSKVEKDETISPKIRECQVILKDIKHQFVNNELELFKEISSYERKSCKKDNYICKFCGKKLSSERNLNQHMKNIHPDGQIDQFECDFDGKIFKKKSELYIHMGCHRALVECQICHKMLKYLAMNSHLRNFHATDKKFQCKICDKRFKSKKYLWMHEKTHNKQFKCEICNKMFSFNSHLDDHKKKYHNNPGSFECEICGRKFNQKYHLQGHQKIHQKNRPKSFQCQRCDYATDNMFRFKNHQKSHERQDKKFAAMKNPLKCEKCPKFCKDKNALNMHMRHVHPKELFQCDLCAKFLKEKSTLIHHINTHISGRYEGVKN
ncbi:zinc finger protein 43-like [Chironomus tepperi]|uniref:zinc finger protein 43-like n=1 Tax=Chironomus tepperi TaxID=113505 RepID=UPI00391F88AF